MYEHFTDNWLFMMESLSDRESAEDLLEKWESKLPATLEQLYFNLNCHPAIAIFLVVFTLVASVPFLIFVCFALGSFAFVLVSFTMIEGVVLAFGTFILAFVLVFAAVAAFSVSLTLGSLWFVLTNWNELVSEGRRFLDKQINNLSNLAT